MIDIWFEMICLHDVLPIDFSINRLVSSLVSILNYIKCHRRFHINHSYAQYSPINYSAAQCNRQNNGCPLATQARWSSVYNNRRLLCSLFVSQCIVAVNKKVGLQSWCSHELPTIDCHSEGTNTSNKAKLPEPSQKASRTFVDQHTSPAPDQTNRTAFTSIAVQDLTYFLPVFPWHLNETSYLQSEIPSLRSQRVNGGDVSLDRWRLPFDGSARLGRSNVS